MSSTLSPNHPSTDSRLLTSSVNVALRLSAQAAERPDAVAVAAPRGPVGWGQQHYAQLTFRQLDEDSSRIASGLAAAFGDVRGRRLALLVRPGLDFVSLVFALFKAGAVIVLIDPGMGRRNLIRCLADAEPEGFIAIPIAQAIRTICSSKFPRATANVTVGRRWFWGGKTLDEIRALGRADFTAAPTAADEPAAIIFTTGSTGPPKGVLYTHGNFDRQVVELGQHYHIEPGEIDLPGFPLFGLFNAALGVTTVIPDMDPTRPAQVDPQKIIGSIRDWQVTQAFGSPALWNRVGRYCEEQHVQLPTLRRVLSAGAPVPPHVLSRMRAAIDPQGEMYTPYGATEALPVASIGSREVLEETRHRTQQGSGTCVGHRFAGIEWKIILITDGPIANLDQVPELPQGEIGELIVSGPVVTREYVTRREANALAKIADGDRFWHRMGDVGYLDSQDRFWFCGRMGHRVVTSAGPMFTEPCEAIFNTHPAVYRSALVGIGPRGQQRPVIIVECWPEKQPASAAAREQLLEELKQLARRNPLTEPIADVLWHPALPVDIRHNSKIFREQLAPWAAQQLGVHHA